MCPISTFRVPRRSKSGWRKQDSLELSHCNTWYFDLLSLALTLLMKTKLPRTLITDLGGIYSLWGKVEIAGSQIFSFSHSVFKPLVLLTG